MVGGEPSGQGYGVPRPGEPGLIPTGSAFGGGAIWTGEAFLLG